MGARPGDQAARQALRDLRRRRPDPAASSPSSCSRSTRASSRPPTTGRSRRSSRCRRSSSRSSGPGSRARSSASTSTRRRQRATDGRPHVVLVHDGHGDDRARRRRALRARRSRTALFGSGEHTDLVRAAFVGLWAAMNYDQLTALFRVEERSVSYSIASLANVAVTIGDHDPARRRPRPGAARSPRRELQRDARRLRRAPRLPAHAARARVRPQASSAR